MKNIILVGFMGTGKTTVGKKLAEKLNMDFLDLDDVIEQREKMSIPDIFQKKGEQYFRDVEKKNIKEIQYIKNTVVSCGGGAVMFDENWISFKKSGIVVCLTANEDIIYERIKTQTHRPLLNCENPKSRIHDLLEKRKVFYAKADYTVDTSTLSIESVVCQVVRYIKDNWR